MGNCTKTGDSARAGLALVIVAVLASSARPEERPVYRPPDYVLTVGVGEYAQFLNIPGATNDPRLMLDVWPDARDRPAPLLNQDATADAILQALQQVKWRVRAGGFSVLFIASHGKRVAGSWAALAYDYDPVYRPVTTSVGGKAIAREVDALVERGDRVLLIVDACFAGQLRSDCEWVLGRAQPRGGQFILLVATVPGQTSNEDGKNGYFSATLAEALRGKADMDGDGLVTLWEVRRYLSWRLPQVLLEHGALPGVPRYDQDFLCDTTANVSDTLVLSRAREKSLPHVTQDDIDFAKGLGNTTSLRPNHLRNTRTF